VGGIKVSDSSVRNHGLLLATTLVERRSSSASEANLIAILATTVCERELTFERRIKVEKGDSREMGKIDDISILVKVTIKGQLELALTALCHHPLPDRHWFEVVDWCLAV
jgi:hypothetical protein